MALTHLYFKAIESSTSSLLLKTYNKHHLLAASSTSTAMVALILVTILFLCALVNSYLFAPSLLLALFKPFFPKPKTTFPKHQQLKKKHQQEQQNVDDDVTTIFSTFDGDSDGFITADELHVSLSRLNLSVKREDVDGMMRKADANGDGLIDVNEFRELYEGLRGLEEKEEDLREAFGVFDGDGDGKITVEELGRVLRGIGLKEGVAEEDCRDMIRRVDLDGDGKVNFEEFRKMMMVKGGKLF